MALITMTPTRGFMARKRVSWTPPWVSQSVQWMTMTNKTLQPRPPWWWIWIWLQKQIIRRWLIIVTSGRPQTPKRRFILLRLSPESSYSPTERDSLPYRRDLWWPAMARALPTEGASRRRNLTISYSAVPSFPAATAYWYYPPLWCARILPPKLKQSWALKRNIMKCKRRMRGSSEIYYLSSSLTLSNSKRSSSHPLSQQCLKLSIKKTAIWCFLRSLGNINLAPHREKASN